MEFGKQLKNIRESKNLSQEYIGNELGIGQPGVSKIENNTREITLPELYVYAKAFGMTAKELLILIDPSQNNGNISSSAKFKLELDLSIDDLGKLNLRERISELLK